MTPMAIQTVMLAFNFKRYEIMWRIQLLHKCFTMQGDQPDMVEFRQLFPITLEDAHLPITRRGTYDKLVKDTFLHS